MLEAGKSKDLNDLLLVVDEISNQLCHSVDDFFDFKVISNSPYPEIQKLSLLINFLLDTARRNIGALESRTLELQQNRTQLAHSEKLATIGELAAGIGHEINNPLTIAMGAFEKINKLSKGIQNIELDRALNMQEAAFQRILSIVGGLRTFSRIDNDTVEAINFNDVVVRTVDLIREIYVKEGIQLVVDLTTEPSFFKGNFGKIQQTIFNVLSNSKDAIKAKSLFGEIRIKTFLDDNRVHLKIVDNGQGMTEVGLARAFEAFYTTKPVGQGTGLGLSIVQQIVELYGGVLLLRSEVLTGTEIEISFPAVGGMVVAPKSQLDQNKKMVGSILVVDDEADIRALVREAFESIGLSVEEACDGQRALDLLRVKTFNFLLTDLKMPVMSGGELILKASKISPQTKLFAMTGGIEISEANKLSADLFDSIQGYVYKPFSMKEIIGLLDPNRSK